MTVTLILLMVPVFLGTFTTWYIMFKEDKQNNKSLKP